MPSKHEIRFDRFAGLCLASAMLFATALPGSLNAEAATTRPPTGGGGTAGLEPALSSQSSRTWRRLVFTCRSPGLVVFSDLPCGPLPIVHELKGLSPTGPTAKAGATSTVVPPTPAASTRLVSDAPRDDGPDEAAQLEATCRRLRDAVRALDDRMRAGYSARKAALLWSRWREARQRLRDADC